MMPVTVPPYYEAAYYVEVRPMRNFTYCGYEKQTPLHMRKKYTLYFKANSAKVNYVQKYYLNRLSNQKYKIIGFASSDGNRKSNNVLSLERANNVANILKQKGAIICSIQYQVGSSFLPQFARKVIISETKC